MTRPARLSAALDPYRVTRATLAQILRPYTVTGDKR